MKKVVIIGAGELGSRHLQGLLKSIEKQIIFVLDPSVKSLGIAEKRANEIVHNHSVNYISDWDGLPKELDLVIVATGANVRKKVVVQLLEGFEVKNLVLEKILFQDLESYHQIDVLLKKTETPTWVNHSRRMAPYYQEIRQNIIDAKEDVVFQIVGGNWGLACNGLHFIDLCCFLTGEKIKELDLEWVDNNIQESKRENNIEFSGSIKGKLENNSSFIITSFNSEPSDISINISTSSQRWIIQEGRAQKIIHLSKDNNFNEVITSFVTEYQSTLTTKIANDIFELGSCRLPTYEEACASHIPFIDASIKKIIEITGIETNICPIT
jgi:predicted dehydrogenase